MDELIEELYKSVYVHLVHIKELVKKILEYELTTNRKIFKKFNITEFISLLPQYDRELTIEFRTETDVKSQLSSTGHERKYEGRNIYYLIAYLFDISIISDETYFIYNIYKTYIRLDYPDPSDKIIAYNRYINEYINKKKSVDLHWQNETPEQYEVEADGFSIVDFGKKYLKYKQKYLHLKNKLTN